MKPTDFGELKLFSNAYTQQPIAFLRPITVTSMAVASFYFYKLTAESDKGESFIDDSCRQVRLCRNEPGKPIVRCSKMATILRLNLFDQAFILAPPQ